MIDQLLFCALFFPITRLVKGVWIMAPADHRWHSGLFITDPICIAFLVFELVYYVALEGLAGETLGKFVLGLRVVSCRGTVPGLWRSAVRNALRIVDGTPMQLTGVILILLSPEKARLGDRVAGTRVIIARQQR